MRCVQFLPVRCLKFLTVRCLQFLTVCHRVFKSLDTCAAHTKLQCAVELAMEMFVAVFPRKSYKTLGQIFEIFNFAKMRKLGTQRTGRNCTQRTGRNFRQRTGRNFRQRTDRNFR